PSQHPHPLLLSLSFPILRRPPPSPLFPYTTLFRSRRPCLPAPSSMPPGAPSTPPSPSPAGRRRAPTRSRLQEPSRRGRSSIHPRSEEHTSELQSLAYLVCRLLLEKKKNT